ncbi:unnamed protein product [Mytilus coruscus]|uniref:Uncharacterized protein n=1 Tax=Mytilus coruscus TaxID=42192 RepID=A0A6J8D3B9_MYTCO|nr:unnamed protein product [Mytilus coruscus]
MKRVLLMLTFLSFNRGLLLDDENPQHGTGSSTYLTVSKYLAGQRSIHHEIEELRNQHELSINLLTSQLKAKFVKLDSLISVKSPSNNTCQTMVDNLEERVIELSENNTRLEYDVYELKSKYNVLSKAFENRTFELNNKIEELHRLKNIQQLQTVNHMQHMVQYLDSSVSSLLSREQARNQDFLALYNITIKSQNSTMSLQRNVSKHMEKVAYFACIKLRTTFDGGATLIFQSTKTSVGIVNSSEIQATGQFNCTMAGIYHISVALNTYSRGAIFTIMKNKNELIRGWVNEYSTQHTYWQFATAVASTELNIGDTLEVIAHPSTPVAVEGGDHSCLTIVKIN